MPSRIKKIIIILGIIILIGGIALFLYAFFDSRNSDRTITQSILNLFPQSQNRPVDTNGDTGDTTGGSDTDGGQDDITDTIPNEQQKLVQISNEPVSGGYFSSTSTVRFIEKSTGNIYEYSYFTNTSRKITNTIIPKIHDSYWVNKDTFIGRYLDDDNQTIKSFIGFIINAGEQGTVSTKFLSDNISSLDINNSSIFYIADVFSGSAGFIYNIENDTNSQVFSSNVRGLTALWYNNNIYVHTNPSNSVEGVLFNVSNGNLTEELREAPGMIATSIDNEILVSIFDSSSLSLGYNPETDNQSVYQSVLIPEKCLSVKSDLYCALDTIPGGFPDNWYLGVISFSDNLYKVTKNEGRVQVYDFNEEVENGIDVINISKSPDEELILFMNKKDDTLWSLELN